MPVIAIEGVGNVTLDDSFTSLPADQQHALIQQIGAQATGQAPAGANAPSGSLGTAAGQSLLHGLPAAVASGVSGLTRYIESATGRNDPTALGNAAGEDAFARTQRLTMAQNYQRPGDVAPSVYAGIMQGKSLGDSLARAGRAALYGAAENAGPLAGGIIAAPLAAEGAADAGIAGLTLRGGALAAGGLQALSGVRDAKARAGLDPNAVTGTDLLNAGGQTALNALHLGDAPALLRPALGAAYGAAKGAIAPLMNDAGALAQGGTLAGNQVASDMLDGGASGGLLGAAGTVPGAARDAVGQVAQAVTDPMRAGAGLAALSGYQRAQGTWDQAVQAEKVKLQANPATMPTDGTGFQDAAEANAVTGGAVKPDMTPDAQRAAARLATLQMFQQRRATELAQNPGMPVDGKADANTFKGMGDDLKTALTGMAGGFLANGLIDPDTHKAFTGAIAEAAKHNRNLGEDGAANGYLDTALDKVQAAHMDPQMLNTFVGGLRVLDDAASNGLVVNAKGPLEKNAGTILPIAGGIGGLAGAAFAGLGPGVEMAGAGIGKQLAQAVGTSWLRNLDRVMGTNRPAALDGSGAILRLAQARGLSPAVTSGDIGGALQDLATLRAPPPVVGLSPSPTQDTGAPVTSPGRGYVGMLQPSPQTAPESPQGPLGPQVGGQVPQGPDGSVAAPGSPSGPGLSPAPGVDGLRAAALLAKAQAAQQEVNTAAMVQSIRQAAPTDRRAWSAAIADTLGVAHAPLLEALQRLAGGDPGMAQAFQADNIPRPLMSALTDHAADLRDAGVLPLANRVGADGAASGPQGAVMGSGEAMRLASYQASIRQAEAAGNAARPVAPAAVAAIEAQTTQTDKRAALKSYLAGVVDPVERARQSAILTPLTLFGPRGGAGGSLGVPRAAAGVSRAANDNR